MPINNNDNKWFEITNENLELIYCMNIVICILYGGVRGMSKIYSWQFICTSHSLCTYRGAVCCISDKINHYTRWRWRRWRWKHMNWAYIRQTQPPPPTSMLIEKFPWNFKINLYDLEQLIDYNCSVVLSVKYDGRNCNKSTNSRHWHISLGKLGIHRIQIRLKERIMRARESNGFAIIFPQAIINQMICFRLFVDLALQQQKKKRVQFPHRGYKLFVARHCSKCKFANTAQRI